MNAPALRMTSRAALMAEDTPSFVLSTPVGPPVLDEDLRRVRACLDGEVLARQDGPQVGARRRRTPAVADRVLAAPEALALRAVVIGGDGEAGRPAGVDPGLEDRIRGPRELRAERPVAAAPRVRAFLPGLAAPEIGQHVGIGPAGRALARPAIVIAGGAARIGHDVDGRRTAEDLAPHGLQPTIVEIGFRLGLVAPVEHLMLVHLAHAERDRNQRIVVATAGFQQKHGHLRILAQAIGQHAARRPCPDDDVIISLHVEPLSSDPRRGARHADHDAT